MFSVPSLSDGFRQIPTETGRFFDQNVNYIEPKYPLKMQKRHLNQKSAGSKKKMGAAPSKKPRPTRSPLARVNLIVRGGRPPQGTQPLTLPLMQPRHHGLEHPSPPQCWKYPNYHNPVVGSRSCVVSPHSQSLHPPPVQSDSLRTFVGSRAEPPSCCFVTSISPQLFS